MVPVSAEQVFTIGSFPVTNSVLTGWIAMALFVVLGLTLRTKKAMVPKGIQNAAEALLEFMLGFMDQVTHDRAKSRKFFPVVGSLFLFILVSNWMGLLPGVGTIGIWNMVHGHLGIVPLIRPATSDLNATLAMGITAVVVSHLFGMMTLGFFKHWNKFIQIGTFWKAVTSFGKKSFADWAIGLFVAIIELGVGLIELISEVAKMISLSLRLFGNIFAGEVLIHVLSSLVAYLVPTPFMFLEIIVGMVQALVFSMLTLVYLTLATDAPHGDEDHGDEHAHDESPADAHAHA